MGSRWPYPIFLNFPEFFQLEIGGFSEIWSDLDLAINRCGHYGHGGRHVTFTVAFSTQKISLAENPRRRERCGRATAAGASVDHNDASFPGIYKFEQQSYTYRFCERHGAMVIYYFRCVVWAF